MRLFIALPLMLLPSGCDRQKAPHLQGEAPPASSEAHSGKIDRSRAGTPAPEMAFLDPEGGPVSLADFRGKPLLLNLWATWCAPCVKEMPTLDALAGRGGNLEVLAVSQDMEGEEAKVAAFFEQRKLANLEPFRDPELNLMMGLEAQVLPTTILYDAEGREVWRMVGAYDWAGADAARLLAEAS